MPVRPKDREPSTSTGTSTSLKGDDNRLRRNTYATTNTITNTNVNTPRNSDNSHRNDNNNNINKKKNNNNSSSSSTPTTLTFTVRLTSPRLPSKPAAMKAMKSMGMNRMLGSIRRKSNNEPPVDTSPEIQLDTPEANAIRNVRLFCESGGPNGSGEEVLYLPTVVESCESSPAAAKEASYIIRKFLSKDNFAKPYVQYNAIMLVRILSDNPGKTFTRNIDAKFVQVVKELLRMGRDPSVKQILMETLDTFAREKGNDVELALLNDMWAKEHQKMVRLHGPAAAPRILNAPPFQTNDANYFSRSHTSRHLPAPRELSSRIEEAKTSAGLLSQVVQSTPPSEVIQNELVREFADRCQSASRSIQAYMIAENPSPDNDTMETLIETNEQLNKAMNQHQRAVLAARKASGMGSGEPTPPPRQDYGNGFVPPPGPPPGRTGSGFAPPPGPPPSQLAARKAVKQQPPIPPPGDYAPTGSDDENPFSDPRLPSKRPGPSTTATHNPPFPSDKPSVSTGQFNDRLGIEPYHPGFRETPSYIGRQDSAVGKTTMHAAIPETPDDDDDNRRRYGGQVAGKEPVYRY
ncbi:uncharacterized protein RAG0_05762 [Rhynchosporium agropyri]|uniref:GAT domain-containing protein n=1 Tax=Rhynchosporium agropyri TaxID=914238 RepID=A0A1E1KEM1_9HELO|nr:uncharacterized protein RAG0_05762 [Rhynchosporium agropyri]